MSLSQQKEELRLFALSDPHLGLSVAKPMHVFGRGWERHHERIAEHVGRELGAQDLLLIPGDISWAINLQEVEADLAFLDHLPGRKWIGRGNHDYWWTSQKKVLDLAEASGWKSLHFIRHSAWRIPEHRLVICGTRLWALPGSPEWQEGEDRRLYLRECQRLDLALAEARKLREEGDRLVVMLHYPPYSRRSTEREVLDRLHAADCTLCIHGHIHGRKGWEMRGRVDQGMPILNTACDVLQFKALWLDPFLEGEWTDESLAAALERQLSPADSMAPPAHSQK